MHRLQMQRILCEPGPPWERSIFSNHIGCPDNRRSSYRRWFSSRSQSGHSRAQRFEIRIFAECLVANKHRGWSNSTYSLLFQKSSNAGRERRVLCLVVHLPARCVSASPFVQPFGKGFFAIKATAQLAEISKSLRASNCGGTTCFMAICHGWSGCRTGRDRYAQTAWSRQHDIGKAAG